MQALQRFEEGSARVLALTAGWSARNPARSIGACLIRVHGARASEPRGTRGEGLGNAGVGMGLGPWRFRVCSRATALRARQKPHCASGWPRCGQATGLPRVLVRSASAAARCCVRVLAPNQTCPRRRTNTNTCARAHAHEPCVSCLRNGSASQNRFRSQMCMQIRGSPARPRARV